MVQYVNIIGENLRGLEFWSPCEKRNTSTQFVKQSARGVPNDLQKRPPPPEKSEKRAKKPPFLRPPPPYQSLINLYLRDCVMKHRTVQIAWPSGKV